MNRVLKILSWLAGGIIALGALGFGALAVAARVVGAPESIGLRDGRLAPCPATPNCVSSQTDPGDTLHYLPPLSFSDRADETAARIRAILASEPRVELLRDDGRYFHAVFRSATMGFPDDVEFYIDEAAGLIHFRSAARLGRDDLGVNRARMERLSAALESLVRN